MNPGSCSAIGSKISNAIQQKVADELFGARHHSFCFVFVAIVFPEETDLAVGERDQLGVGDSEAIGIAAGIGRYLFGNAELWFGIDDPFDPPEPVGPGGEGRGLAGIGEVAGMV